MTGGASLVKRTDNMRFAFPAAANRGMINSMHMGVPIRVWRKQLQDVGQSKKLKTDYVYDGLHRVIGYKFIPGQKGFKVSWHGICVGCLSGG